MKKKRLISKFFLTIFFSLITSYTLAEEKIRPLSALPYICDKKNDAPSCLWKASYNRMIVDIIKAGSDEKYYLTLYFKHKPLMEAFKSKKTDLAKWGDIKIYNMESGELYKIIQMPSGRRSGTLNYSAYPEETVGADCYSYELTFLNPGQYLISAEFNPHISGIEDTVLYFKRLLWHK